jgi:hypothetical protein
VARKSIREVIQKLKPKKVEAHIGIKRRRKEVKREEISTLLSPKMIEIGTLKVNTINIARRISMNTRSHYRFSLTNL